MVFLSGPRQVGKTYLAKNLYDVKNCEYLNWDVFKHKKIIKSESWDQLKELLVFDEIHKLKTWKNYLKGIFDQQLGQKILVTGSAKLDTFRKSGDALTGRYFYYRLYPFDYSEALKFSKLKSADLVSRLLLSGGFPEAFFHPADANRIRENRIHQVFQEDLRELTQIQSIKDVSFLIELLRERVGGISNYANLATDIGVSPITIKSWMDQLERLYIIVSIPPFSKKMKRAIKKDKKYFFYDCSLSNSDGGRAENLMAITLLKYCHFNNDTRGEDWKLYFYRDKEKREVDFIVEKNNKPFWVIEVKNKDDSFGKGLLHLKEKFHEAKFFQISIHDTQKQKIHNIEKISYADFSKDYVHY